eukprot:4873954-Ditylum_brightwellii.AAC.1
MTDISGVTLGKKEDEEKETSSGPTTKEGEKALTGQSNFTNTSNKKAKEMCREMNKSKATANLPPHDDDSGTDESSDNEKDDKSAFTGGTAINPKHSQTKDENSRKSYMILQVMMRKQRQPYQN